ncbi:MAG: pilus assembly protein [Beutenbergiaceae bacterium]
MRLQGWVRHRWRRRCDDERGSAVVEFLGVSLVLLIPLVYLIVAMAQLQAASFAAEGAAREAGRLIVRAATFDEGVAAAQLGVELAFADQGLSVDGASVLQIGCSATPCLTPGEYVVITVQVDVALPLAPDFLPASIPTTALVSAQAMAPVGEFRD